MPVCPETCTYTLSHLHNSQEPIYSETSSHSMQNNLRLLHGVWDTYSLWILHTIWKWNNSSIIKQKMFPIMVVQFCGGHIILVHSLFINIFLMRYQGYWPFLNGNLYLLCDKFRTVITKYYSDYKSVMRHPLLTPLFLIPCVSIFLNNINIVHRVIHKYLRKPRQ
jgi:hypothetical protein